MTIFLDGERLPGYDHRVTGQAQLARRDQSGDNTGTGSTHQGWKAWVIGVSCKVRFRDRADLARLRQLFQERDGAGAPRLFIITDDTAAALGVDRVRFADFLRVEPDERQRIWHVKFTLSEERSKPEMMNKRQPPAPAREPGAPAGFMTTETVDGPAVSSSFIGRMFATMEEFASRFSLLKP